MSKSARNEEKLRQILRRLERIESMIRITKQLLRQICESTS